MGGVGGGEGATQFADLLQRGIPKPELVRYVTTGVYSTLELLVRALEGSPASSFLLCLAQRCSGPASGSLSRLPPPEGMGSSCRPLPRAVHRLRAPTAGYLASTTKEESLRRASRPGEYLAGLDAEWEDHLTRWTDPSLR